VMVMFSEGPSFPMIFESATAGFEDWKPTCETLMIISISGGALQPAMMALLVEKVGISMGWTLTMSCFAVVLTYPVALNIIPSFRKAVDAAKTIENAGRGGVLEEAGADEENIGAKDVADARKEGFREIFKMVPMSKKVPSANEETPHTRSE
jgi:hypothetical protein